MPDYSDIPVANHDTGDPVTEFNHMRDDVIELGTLIDAVAPGPNPMLEGRWYTSPQQFTTLNTDANVFGTSGQVMYMFPMYFAEETFVDRFGQQIFQAGNGLLWMGLYSIDAAAQSATRLAQGSTDATVTGDKEVTTSVTVPPGPALGAIGTTDTSGTLRVKRVANQELTTLALGSTTGRDITAEGSMKFTGVDLSSGLPATVDIASPASYVRVDWPIIWVRRGAA